MYGIPNGQVRKKDSCLAPLAYDIDNLSSFSAKSGKKIIKFKIFADCFQINSNFLLHYNKYVLIRSLH